MNKTRMRLCLRLGLALLLAIDGIGTATAQIDNTAYGAGALTSATGNYNSAFGVDALALNTGNFNSGVGADALYFNTGSSNTATGQTTLYFNTSGSNNTGDGRGALTYNTTGSNNTAAGYSALYNNKTGSNNVGTGVYALMSNKSGSYNNAFGYDALFANTNGTKNVAVGGSALYRSTIGNYNEAVGSQALYGNTTGSSNIGIGYQAGYYPQTGSNNIEIGAAGATTDNATIRIGTQGTQKATYVAGISGVNVTGGTAVVVNSKGELGVVSSSRRYKDDIRSMGNASSRLLSLRPVTFRYKQADAKGQKPEQYGLIAEEVAKVMPELVVYNETGQPETVAYQALAPLLLNELQRERQRSMQEARDLNRQLSAQAQQLKVRDTRVDSLEGQVLELRRVVSQMINSRQ